MKKEVDKKNHSEKKKADFSLLKFIIINKLKIIKKMNNSKN
jgi:hypothetical protein